VKLNYDFKEYDLPFKHYVCDEFLSIDDCIRINQDWPDDEYTEWDKEDGKACKKWSTNRFGLSPRNFIESIDIEKIEEITGFKNLLSDPLMYGAGLHAIPKGGRLNMHVDFNVHPKGLIRKVNILTYVNLEWHDHWKGDLWLGSNLDKKISPKRCRCVIFETNDNSWHGHPFPTKCPDGVFRRSIALYLYQKPKKGVKPHSTIYKNKGVMREVPRR